MKLLLYFPNCQTQKNQFKHSYCPVITGYFDAKSFIIQ